MRIAIPVRMHVSFADLLTLLLFTPGVNLTYAELLDDDMIRDSVHFALVSTDLVFLENRTGRTMAIYQGEAVGEEVPPAAYVAGLSAAITRVFGVTA
ncbi:hypothetical protein ACFXHD_24855 [Streptomyces hydrogenans]|uniref:hypothetical protein n=1 Tax=Streptomyces hydrogenans TaxID=1873719 RepID=UPI003676F093